MEIVSVIRTVVAAVVKLESSVVELVVELSSELEYTCLQAVK